MNIQIWHNMNKALPLKEGDYVKIREDLRPNARYGPNSTNGSMPYFAGITTQIHHVFRDWDEEQYQLEADGMTWYWTKEMLDRGNPNDVKANKKIAVGDTVTIWDDLEAGKKYGSLIFVSEMERYMGQTTTVLDVVADDTHTLFTLENAGAFCWSPEMLIKRG